MDRQFLESCLADGLSLDQIGSRVNRAPSTVSYHLKKHGLDPVNKGTHANKGGICEEVLEILVEDGVSLQEMANQLDRSVSTIRYWLERYGLEPAGLRRRQQAASARRTGAKRVQMDCPRHGLSEFILEGRGYYRCARCRSEAVMRRRKKVKGLLVAEFGGECRLCGYSANVRALHFHHLDPSTKEFNLAFKGMTRGIAELRAEAQKCVLLCSNCHAEVEDGMAQAPGQLA